MTYVEFQRHVGKAGLTIKAFAALIRMNRISLSNYAKQGEVPSHLAVIAALLGEMADRGVDYKDVLSRIDIAPKKPRGTGKRFVSNAESEPDLFGHDEPNEKSH